MKKQIQFKLNGETRIVDVSPDEFLLDLLRDRLGVKGPKKGCDRGDCGSCTVLFDGRSVRSCLIFAIEADGHEIVTIEGLAKEKLHPVQQAFLERNAFQCGFCAPGMVISAVDLLNRNPHPTREEIQEALSGNLCRCTGYEPIIEAILDAAAKMGGE